MDTCFVTAPPEHEFQAERCKLPYALPPLSATRPVISSIVGGNPTVPVGAALTLNFTGTVTRASLMSPTAVTHQLNMNQRAFNLRVVINKDEITVFMPPPGGRVAPAGWYMLFLLNGDVPCTEAVWVKLTNVAEAGDGKYPSTPLVHNLNPIADISTGFESEQCDLVWEQVRDNCCRFQDVGPDCRKNGELRCLGHGDTAGRTTVAYPAGE